MNNQRPTKEEYAPYYFTYVGKVGDGNMNDLLKSQIEETLATFKSILDENDEKGNYRYAEGKWSIKELLNHMIDTERVMAYRALRIARGDKTPLPGFEQNDYVASFDANARPLKEMLEEFEAVRQSTTTLFKSFTDEMLLHRGTASGFPVSVRALGYIILGHELHHMSILKERYFSSF